MPAETHESRMTTVGGLPGYPLNDDGSGLDGGGGAGQGAIQPYLLAATDWIAMEAVRDGRSVDAAAIDRLLAVRLLESNAADSFVLSATGVEALIMKRAGFYKLLAKLLKTVGAEDQPLPQNSIWRRFRSGQIGGKAIHRRRTGLLGSALLRPRSYRPAVIESADAGL